MAPASEAQLRDWISRLAAIERGSASPGEREAAELIAAELRGYGAEVHLEQESAHGTYWWPIGLATGVAALAGLSRRRLAPAAVAALAAMTVIDDLRLWSRWLRRVLRRKKAVNVVASVGSPSADRTLVLVAHHDAAHSGLVFHPELARSWARRFPRLLERTNTTPPTMWPAVAGPALVSLAALLRVRVLRRIGTALSAGFTVAMADIGARGVVPGANDNLTGVAVLLSLARELSEAPVHGLRVMLVSTGAEESFMEGMEGFGRRHFPSLPSGSTYFVCLDTVGSPHLLLLEGEGMLGIREYPKDFLGLIRECADRLGIFVLPKLRLRNATDGLIALRAGYPSAMIGSADRFKMPANYHWPTDTADNVDYGTVADAARLCRAVVERLSAGQPARRAGPEAGTSPT